MELKSLLLSNTVDKELANKMYIERIKKQYTNYQVFIKQSDPDFLYFRKKVGESTFGIKPNVFTVDITVDVKIHYTQLYKLIN